LALGVGTLFHSFSSFSPAFEVLEMDDSVKKCRALCCGSIGLSNGGSRALSRALVLETVIYAILGSAKMHPELSDLLVPENIRPDVYKAIMDDIFAEGG